MTENLPARGYAWPPFEAGNEAALTHGAYSPSRVEPLAIGFVELIHANPNLPHLQAAAFSFELWAWARAEAQVQLLTDYLGNGFDSLGDKRDNAARLLLKEAENRAAKFRNSLGLNPLSLAKIRKDMAIAGANQRDPVAEFTALREAESGTT